MYNRIAVDTIRTAAITRLRMDLSGMDRQRKELFARLGERVDELRRSDRISDMGMLALLEEEFTNLDRIEKRIGETLAQIQELNLHDEDSAEEGESEGEVKEGEKGESLLESFDVT
jgi:hypothetical protein